LYENGVDEDYQEAIKWYKQAATHATHPNTEAQYQLGNCYYNGLGVSEDKKEAKQWYLKAAENGRDIPRKLKKELGI
jgi:TPR repeat protein